jgi:hypothetical protein
MKRLFNQAVAGGAVGVTALASLLSIGPGTAVAEADLHLDSQSFSAPTSIDNRWSPLRPGMQLTLQGEANAGNGVVPRRIVFTVTDLTKVVHGLPTLVSWDRDYTDGQLSEAELAFHAQDDGGTVWNVGEYPEEYDAGRFLGAPKTWLHGVDGAEGGILMKARPRAGTPTYLQWKSPAIDSVDVARVAADHQRVCVPVGCFDDVVVLDESDPHRPEDGHQLKYHAPGVGVIRVDFAQGVEQESLVLVSRVPLSPQGLAAARAEALKLDRRAYQVSPLVYRFSWPAMPLPIPFDWSSLPLK